MEVLVLDGKEYTKAAKAARDLGYTADYVGQLCRSGQVTAHLIGRTWYVDKDELTSHRHEKKRMSRVKAREQAKKTIAEHRAKKQSEEKNYKNLAISYETDPSELIPETRKVEVESDAPKKKGGTRSGSVGPKYEIDNKGEKIIMKGKVKIEDASDEVLDPHTTILKPTIISGDEEEETTPKKKATQKRVRAAREESEIDSEPTKDFMAKLQDREALSLQEDRDLPEDVVMEAPEADSGVQQVTESRKPSLLVPALIVLTLAAVAIMSVPLSRTTMYTADSVVPVSNSFTYDVNGTLELFGEKF